MNYNHNNFKLEQSYFKSPYHKYQHPIPHDYNQNANASESPRQVLGPYGVSFDETQTLDKDIKKKYR